MASGPLNPKGLGRSGGFNANIGADPFALRTVQGAAQHYAQQRAGRTLIHPTLVGKKLKVRLVTGVAEISAAAPSTVKSSALGDTAFQSSSDADVTYGNLKKILLKLEGPIPAVSLNSFRPTLLLDGLTDYYTNAVVNSALASNVKVRTVLKITPIVADFDISTQTWNNYGSLSLAASDAIVSYRDSMRVNKTSGGGLGDYTLVANACGEEGVLTTDLQAVAAHLDANSDTGLIYGFVLECGPTVTGSGSWGTLTSVSALFALSVADQAMSYGNFSPQSFVVYADLAA